MYFTKCINYYFIPIKMLQFNSPETARRTAIYVRISTNKQQTDRQVVELKEYRKTLTEFTVFEESLRIVEEALFYRVNEDNEG